MVGRTAGCDIHHGRREGEADGVFVIRLPTGLQKNEAGEEKTAVPPEDG
jgi:hypothetical protein